MKHYLLVAVFAALAVSGCNKAEKHDDKAKHEVHWGYEGEGAPEKWGTLKPDYATCKDGKAQTPINIDTKAVAGKAEPISFDYKAIAENITNNGHTIQVNMAKGSSITVGGKSYELLQFHFHAPSEHTVDGKHADMVAHLVHKAADGQLGVVGVLMNKGASANAALAKLGAFPAKAGDVVSLTAANFNAADLLPADRNYWNYTGSLTTPPCTEGVNWMVLQAPVEVSAAQVDALTTLFPKSVRPIQPLNDRVVKSSK